MNQKPPRVGGLAVALLFILLFLMLSTCQGGGTSTPSSLTPQGFLGNTPQGAAEASPTIETFVQLDGQPIQPQLGPIVNVIVPGTQWVLKDLWEDYRCQNVEGRTICYDWGFFCILGGSRCVVAECMDPFWDLPTRGMVYTANPNVAASTSIVLIPPTDIPAPEEGWQKFLTIYEVLNANLALPSPTSTISPSPGTIVPGATSFAVMPGTPQPTGSGVPLSTLLKWCIPVIVLMILVITFLAIRNRRRS